MFTVCVKFFQYLSITGHMRAENQNDLTLKIMNMVSNKNLTTVFTEYWL